MRYLTSLLLILTLNPVHSQTAEDFNQVVQSLSKQLVSANKTGKPQRLAVVTFVSTKAQNNKDKNEFGEYVTESLISSLNNSKSAFKMFERKRLDAVLKESDLMLSDLVNPEAAQKVGELVPIDVLFSGTYTKLKNYVDVNGRLIDVVTGEIYVSFSGRIKMTEDIVSLFGDDTKSDGGTTAPAISEAERCKQFVKSFSTKLNDLSTNEKVNAIVSEAIKTPFDQQCGRIHYDILYMFTRYKVDNSKYHQFLLKTLDTIAFPDLDERATEITRFFGKDGQVTEDEWKAGFSAIRRMGSYRIYICMDKLFPLEENVEPPAEYNERINEYMQAALSSEIGLPKPISFNAAFGFASDGLKDQLPLTMYAYDRYNERLDKDESMRKKINSLLTSIYKKAEKTDDKKTIIKWLAEFYNSGEKNEKTADQLFDFTRSFELTTNKERNKEIQKDFPVSDLEYFISLCKNKISVLAPLTQYNSQKEDRIKFCLKYDIPIAGLIPTISEAQTILDGQDWEEQVRVAELLEKMGKKPKPLEATLLKFLDKRSLDHKDELQKIQESALVILGNIQTTNAKAINQMIASMMSYEYALPDKAKDALVSIGKPAVPYLLQKWNSLTNQDGGLMYSIATIFSRMGKEAAEAKPALQKALPQAFNKDVKYAIEAALQAIE